MRPEVEARGLGRWAYPAARPPLSLEELAGPVTGRVELPLHRAWSGLRDFDTSDVKLLLGMYRIVLNNGSREDVIRYLNADLLVDYWPLLRKMLGRGVRSVWEDAFPVLRPVAAA